MHLVKTINMPPINRNAAVTPAPPNPFSPPPEPQRVLTTRFTTESLLTTLTGAMRFTTGVLEGVKMSADIEGYENENATCLAE
jgi:hypothetical protein